MERASRAKLFPDLRLRKLDCDHAVETGVAGSPHLSHAAHAQRAEQLIGSNPITERESATSHLYLNNPYKLRKLISINF